MNRYSKTTVPSILLLALVPILVVGCTPSVAPEPSVSVANPPASTSTDTEAGETAQMVSLRVPTMHCPFACWPKVKETLQQQEGVGEVTLAKQAKEDEIDNPVVQVRVAGPFDSAKAIEALAAAGFDQAVVE